MGLEEYRAERDAHRKLLDTAVEAAYDEMKALQERVFAKPALRSILGGLTVLDTVEKTLLDADRLDPVKVSDVTDLYQDTYRELQHPRLIGRDWNESDTALQTLSMLEGNGEINRSPRHWDDNGSVITASGRSDLALTNPSFRVVL